MTANVMVVVERQFDVPRPALFRAWTEPSEMARWRGSSGWHVEAETADAHQAVQDGAVGKVLVDVTA